jgi:hypothetical protein
MRVSRARALVNDDRWYLWCDPIRKEKPMTNFGKLALSLLAIPGLMLVSSTAFAFNTPAECGNFDFNKNSAGCAIKVEGGCTAECKPLNFVAGCKGGCSVSATTMCTGDCGTQCLAQCNPAALDCMNGCHTECDQPAIARCQMTNPPPYDCVAAAKAACQGHCEDSCNVPMMGADPCQDHCIACCSGSCTTDVNMSCDLQCFATLEGGCNVACTRPEGGLFCNGQYVNASDVQGCISALVAQGLQVDVSAQASVTCGITGCDGTGTGSVGGLSCAAAPGTESPFAPIVVAMGMAAAGISMSRRRNRKNG